MKIKHCKTKQEFIEAYGFDWYKIKKVEGGYSGRYRADSLGIPCLYRMIFQDNNERWNGGWWSVKPL